MSNLTITKEETGSGGRYVATLDGAPGEAELVFTHRGKDVISADHTGVPDVMGSQGVGTALVRQMVEDARAEGFRVIPACPFVRAQIERHANWADVIAAG